MTIEIRVNEVANKKQHIEKKRSDLFRRWKHILLFSKTGTAGLIIVWMVILTAIFAPYLAPHDPTVMDARNTLAPPFWMENGSTEHILGTDNLGRDLLSRIIYGTQISLLVSVASVLIAGVIGISLGVICGFYGGKWFDHVIMRVVDAKMAIPGILLMLVIIGVFGSSVTTLILVLGFTEWTAYTRLVRGEVLKIKQLDYVKAARSIGTKDRTIMFKHILPNIVSICIVISTLTVGGNIVLEASLSFLGLGVQPPIVSWGYMLNEGRDHIATSWWISTFPGIAISLSVLGIIFLGDWLRDLFDPRTKS
ncbi:ABC transporter permease [Metabacillus halosaccharovorans]|uniref:ABC transporter permease subunit n=1 Tax=Metabacillus halosaccharovorans TaxID=930124 RepID=UPI00403D5669